MARRSRILPSHVAYFIGIFFVVIGFILWAVMPIDSKLFQLSNDLIGAGVFTVALGVTLRVLRGLKFGC